MLVQNNNLLQIQRQYLDLLRKIEEAEGEITDEIDQALQFTQTQMQEAGINVGLSIRSLEYSLEVIEMEIERLGNLRLKINKAKELLKNRLSQSMQQFGIEKITSPTISISFRKSEAVEITDDNTIPAAYFIQPPAYPSKQKIKEAIKQGIEVPGAELVQHKNIQIK